jgi:GT2 family glycosyltransferase
MKILGIMPTHKAMEIKAVTSLIKMQREVFLKGDDIEIVTYSGFNPYFSRNKLMKYAITQDVDWVLSLDSDQMYSAGVLYRLIRHNLDIVAAKYYVSGGVGLDARPLAGGNWKDKERKKFTQIFPSKNEIGLHKCDVFGFGFMLIKPEALKKIYKEGEDFFTPSSVVHQTDDVLFCNRAKDCGIDIYYDADCVVGHLSVTANI